MALYEFFTSRNNGSNVASYIGQAGRLFYDSDNGVVKLSDGTTPGGLSIPYTIATTTVVGGIKAGPGANVATDGTLTIDTAGLPLSFGNISVVDTTLSAVNADADIQLAANGTGNVELIGNVHFHTTASGGVGRPFFDASSDGQITILVPAADPIAGAVKIVGSSTGRVFPPLNTGVMLQLTGNNNDPSRFYNDGINSFPAFVGRRINGNLTVPTAVVAGDDLLRISVTGHNGTTVPGSGSGRILFQSLETHTPTAAGSNISIWTTPVGSNVLAKIATVDNANGLTVTKATVQGNLTVQGNFIGNAVTTTATIGTANIGNVNVGANGTITTPRILINDGGIRDIQDGIWANLSFATDSIVHCFNPSGDLTVNLNGYTAGATIRLIVSMNTRRSINYGVAAARNSTTGATSIPSNALLDNQCVQLTYTCMDGTSANTYVAVSRV
jgi:hypothetical protein